MFVVYLCFSLGECIVNSLTLVDLAVDWIIKCFPWTVWCQAMHIWCIYLIDTYLMLIMFLFRTKKKSRTLLIFKLQWEVFIWKLLCTLNTIKVLYIRSFKSGRTERYPTFRYPLQYGGIFFLIGFLFLFFLFGLFCFVIFCSFFFFSKKSKYWLSVHKKGYPRNVLHVL